LVKGVPTPLSDNGDTFLEVEIVASLLCSGNNGEFFGANRGAFISWLVSERNVLHFNLCVLIDWGCNFDLWKINFPRKDAK